MNIAFYIAASVAVVATVLVITRANAVHALLYLIVSFFAVAVTFVALGSPFVAALEVIVYAGAIMVLFVFVLMLLNLGTPSERQERIWMRPATWIGPGILSVILLIEMIAISGRVRAEAGPLHFVSPKDVGISLFTTYILGVEMASMILLAGIIGTYTIGKRPAGDDTRNKRGEL